MAIATNDASFFDVHATKIARDSQSGCWLWLGSRHGGRPEQGYAMVRVGKKVRRANRVAFEATHGPIPEGMCVLHRCDNPGCVNPEHLFLGTHLDNAMDRDAKGRHWVVPPVGEKNGQAKLTEEQAKQILFNNSASHTVIAALFGVSRRLISMIKQGKRWGHLQWL